MGIAAKDVPSRTAPTGHHTTAQLYIYYRTIITMNATNKKRNNKNTPQNTKINTMRHNKHSNKILAWK